MPHTDTVIIGAGQAGLALSHLLTAAEHDHVVLERGRVGERWRSERWDSLALLTPAWANRLPGESAPDDPAAFESSAAFVRRLECYAWSFGAPVRPGTTVVSVTQAPGGLRVVTDCGTWDADNVVLASGESAAPRVPWFATGAPAGLTQLHASRYRAPDALPSGGVLVVGSGPSGHQLADELARAGRPVILAVGRHARIPRRYRGRDLWCWLHALGDLGRTLEELQYDPRERGAPALPLDGREGGRTVDLATLAAAGVRITGRLEGFAGDHALFGSELADRVAEAERRLHRLLERIDEHIGSGEPEHIAPVRLPPARTAIDLAAEYIATIVWATGYRPHYPWLRVPDALAADGGIAHDRGCTAVPGLYVLGARWQTRLTSHQIGGVGADARLLAQNIVDGAAPSRLAA